MKQIVSNNKSVTMNRQQRYHRKIEKVKEISKQYYGDNKEKLQK